MKKRLVCCCSIYEGDKSHAPKYQVPSNTMQYHAIMYCTYRLCPMWCVFSLFHMCPMCCTGPFCYLCLMWCECFLSCVLIVLNVFFCHMCPMWCVCSSCHMWPMCCMCPFCHICSTCCKCFCHVCSCPGMCSSEYVSNL